VKAPGFLDYAGPLLDGALVTVEIAVAAELVALAIGLIVGPALLTRFRYIFIVYVELFRGTSALIQLFFLFFVLPQFGVSLEPFTVAIWGLGLNSGAYCAEFIRGAIVSVPKGQREAALALGLTEFKTFLLVVFPLALPRALPPLANMSIDLLKLTSVVSLITISDITFVAYQVNQTTLDTFSLFSTVLVFYFVVAQGIAAAFRAVERRVKPRDLTLTEGARSA
jgi:polar amino acid transport system permease protein